MSTRLYLRLNLSGGWWAFSQGIAALIILSILGNSASAAELFTVSRIPVETTADSASSARTKALGEAERIAFERILRRLVSRSDWGHLPSPSSAIIESTVLGVEIAEERTSAARYSGKVTVAFRPDEIRRVLRDAGVAFTESMARPTLVVPVLERAGSVSLWGENNVWSNAWAQVQAQESLLNLILPKGDSEDRVLLSPEQAIALNQPALMQLARKSGAGMVMVVVARSMGQRTDIIASRLEGGRVTEFKEQIMGEADLNAFFRAAQNLHDRIEEEWKQSTLLRFEQRDELLTQAEFKSLSEWLTIRKRLSEVAEIRKTEIGSLSIHDADLRLTYLGDVQRLVIALSQKDLLLKEQDGVWYLRLAAKSDFGNKALIKPEILPQ